VFVVWRGKQENEVSRERRVMGGFNRDEMEVLGSGGYSVPYVACDYHTASSQVFLRGIKGKHVRYIKSE
jgi:hypothetical protein